MNQRLIGRKTIVGSILASGAALAAATSADASIVTIQANKTIGYGTGDLSTYTVSLPGSAGLQFGRSSGYGSKFVYVHQTAAVANVGIRVTGTKYSPVLGRSAAGKTYQQVGANGLFTPHSQAHVAGSTFGHVIKDNSGGIYSAFKFADSSVPGGFDFGYFSGTVAGGAGNLEYTLNTIVYDNTGASLPTGAVPEPTSLGLAALAIGAAAMRRPRKVLTTVGEMA